MTRDFTRKQFLEAAKRNGFSIHLLWLRDETREDDHGALYGMRMNMKGKVLRRESLVKAIAERERDRERAGALSGAQYGPVFMASDPADAR